ncbi:MAG: hypothetical protein EA422_00065 [Gemmatimonadales bacterium]|nr:MAG: hypothetical protein EA422_00065 [Gemmatimonadales bacterium]
MVQHHLETFLAKTQEADPMGWGVPLAGVCPSCNARRMAEVRVQAYRVVEEVGPLGVGGAAGQVSNRPTEGGWSHYGTVEHRVGS